VGQMHQIEKKHPLGACAGYEFQRHSIIVVDCFYLLVYVLQKYYIASC
jgi:hypothetical protein